ncbi:MAG: DUF4397 domain-containing protein [Woeseiaceae bacterium]|nr:DUF4397 domain-containing protein [Woeseiaceae bacterium]
MKFNKLFATVASLFVLAACSSSDPEPLPDAGDDAAVTAPAFIQVLHASADAPPVDVLVNGAVAIPDFDYKQGSGLIELEPATEYQIAVSAQLPGDDAVVIGGEGEEVFLTFDAGTITTISAIGNAAEIGANVFTQLNNNPTSGNAEISVLHAVPGAGEVVVYATAFDADLAASAPVGTFDFGGTLGPVEVPAGEYQIRAALASAPTTAIFDSGAIDVPAGRFLIAAVPSTTGGDSPLSLTVLTQTGSFEIFDVSTQAVVRAVHNATDVPAVDIAAGGAVAIPNLTFPNVSDTIEVPGGTYTIEVALEGQYPAGVAIGPVDLDFDTGTVNTVVARGTILNDDLDASQLAEDTRSVALYSKVRVFHGASTAPAVDVYLVAPGSTDLSGGPAIAGLDYAASSGFAAVPAGTYDAIVTLAGTETIAIGPAALPELTNGDVVTVIARDPMMGSEEFGLTLFTD